MSPHAVIHLALHVLVPLAVAWLFYKEHWQRSFAIMIATMAIDLDHLWSQPFYDPQRCSIASHPFHGAYAVPAYILLLGFRRTRLIGVGLLIHIVLDGVDCTFM